MNRLKATLFLLILVYAALSTLSATQAPAMVPPPQRSLEDLKASIGAAAWPLANLRAFEEQCLEKRARVAKGPAKRERLEAREVGRAEQPFTDPASREAMHRSASTR